MLLTNSPLNFVRKIIDVALQTLQQSPPFAMLQYMLQRIPLICDLQRRTYNHVYGFCPVDRRTERTLSPSPCTQFYWWTGGTRPLISALSDSTGTEQILIR